MKTDAGISAVVDVNNIFDNLPSEAPDTFYIMIFGAISQSNNTATKSNRVSVQIMSWNKDEGDFPTLRNIYQAVNNFLIGGWKEFWTQSVYMVEEANYIEAVDELWKNNIINDYFFNFVKNV